MRTVRSEDRGLSRRVDLAGCERPHDDPSAGWHSREDDPHAADETAARWSRLFAGRSAREILERLMDGDPAEIEPRCRELLREQALLLDPTRLYVRSLARVAHAARLHAKHASLDQWLRERIAESIDDLIEEDREAERSGIPPSEPWDPRYAFISEVLGLEPTIARRACADFNVLPHRVRHAFFAIAVEGTSIRRYVAEGHGPPARVKADLAHAARILGRTIGSRMLDEREDGDDDE